MIPTLGDRWRQWLCKHFGHEPGSYYYGVTGTYYVCKRCQHCVEVKHGR